MDQVRWESSDAAAELSTQTGCRDPVWEQDSLELYLSLGLSDPQAYLELDIAPAGGFFGGLIHNPSGRTGTDAFPLGVAYDPAHPWMIEGVICSDVQVQGMMAGLHWNVTRHDPTVDDLATVRADLTVPMSVLRGRAGARGETFGSLDGQTGAGGPAWVREWYDNANSEPDGRVMRKPRTYAVNNSGLFMNPHRRRHVDSGRPWFRLLTPVLPLSLRLQARTSTIIRTAGGPTARRTSIMSVPAGRKRTAME